MTPLIYEADPAEFMDRAKRSHALHAELRSGIGIADAQAWAAAMRAILAEVALPSLVVGVRYRLRVLRGEFVMKHAHGRTAEGELVGMDVPILTDTDLVEIEGVYGGRAPRGGPYANLHLFEMGGRWAAIADTDVLRLEERP